MMKTETILSYLRHGNAPAGTGNGGTYTGGSSIAASKADFSTDRKVSAQIK